MFKAPKQNISAKKATALLKDGSKLFDLCIEGELKIESTEKWNKQLVIENCLIEYFSGSVTQFEKQVQFINCNFKNCQFVFTYFLGGLTIENCTFDNYLDFQAGGHNQKGNSIIIANNDFKGFVNFFDCIYEDDVIIENNKFQKGTNLLGKPFNIPVTFNIKPFIEKNVGQLDANDEGETR